MSTGFLDARIVQVHPTRRCNLACTHCYSTSGPRMRGELPLPALVARLSRLRAEGYEVVSFSGGEPLLYGAFDEAAAEARGLGFRVNAISNGLLLTPRRAARLAELVTVLGLSVDGNPARHDALRGLPGAFDKLTSRLSLLREHGIAFGLSHCVTRESIEDLPWLLEHALEHGARLLQLHPLTLAGRAATTCEPLALSGADLARAFLLAQLLQLQADGRLLVQADIAALAQVRAQRQRYAVLDLADGQDALDRPLADLVNPLVVDEHGDAWPLAHGMAASQRIATGDAEAWNAAIDGYKRDGAAPLRRLLTAAFDAVERDAEPFVDWYGRVVAVGHARKRRRPALPLSA